MRLLIGALLVLMLAFLVPVQAQGGDMCQIFRTWCDSNCGYPSYPPQTLPRGSFTVYCINLDYDYYYFYDETDGCCTNA